MVSERTGIKLFGKPEIVKELLGNDIKNWTRCQHSASRAHCKRMGKVKEEYRVSKRMHKSSSGLKHSDQFSISVIAYAVVRLGSHMQHIDISYLVGVCGTCAFAVF